MTSPSRQAAEDLVRLALRRPLSERESFLHDNCPDPILRAEIDALLKLRGEAAASPGRRSGDDLDDEEDLPPGSHVGPYIVVDRLGRGGMGQVFLGSDPRLHRKVALKCLTPSQPGGESTGDDDLRQRILHEARAAARINHPNVATIHDVLEHEGRAFIVMEYVEGESLAARLIRERLPIERVITIGRQLAAALSAAHAKGVIHRDLKPGNVHLTPEGSAKVLDFGVAKAATALATASTTRAAVSTRGARESGQLGSPGTPGYMSPEQMLGGAVDERSDIYSLGVMLFEMSTGRRPFPSTDPVALAAAVAQRPPRADGADPTVPRELANIVARALEVDPRDRFQSAAELGLELARLGQAMESATTTAGVLRPAPAVGTTRRALRLAASVLAIPLVLAILGLLTSAAFNLTLGRTGPFGWEPPQAYIVWGLRSLVAPLTAIAAILIFVWAIKFAARLLSLFLPVDRVMRPWRRRLGLVASRLSLDDPLVLAQAIALLGAVAIGIVGWRFKDLIDAWTSGISNARPEQLLPLRPANGLEKTLYRSTLVVLVVAFGVGLYQVVRLRARHGTRRGIGALSVVVAIVALLVLMAEWPYRIFFQNDFEKITFAGTRCYVIGQHVDDRLVYCPDTDPPRNRVIKGSDPAVRRLGIVESIFTPSDRR